MQGNLIWFGTTKQLQRAPRIFLRLSEGDTADHDAISSYGRKHMYKLFFLKLLRLEESGPSSELHIRCERRSDDDLVTFDIRMMPDMSSADSERRYSLIRRILQNSTHYFNHHEQFVCYPEIQHPSGAEPALIEFEKRSKPIKYCRAGPQKRGMSAISSASSQPGGVSHDEGEVFSDCWLVGDLTYTETKSSVDIGPRIHKVLLFSWQRRGSVLLV